MTISYLHAAWFMDGSVWTQAHAHRDRSSRFVGGVSGNPIGKHKGTLNRMTQLKLALSVDEGGAVARAVIDRALAGDPVAVRLCFAAILPKAQARPVELALATRDGRDLHSACKSRGSAAQGGAAELLIAAPREPLPTFGSACIRPAFTGRRVQGGSVDRLHSACNFRSTAPLSGQAECSPPRTAKLRRPHLPYACIAPAFSGDAATRHHGGCALR
jgi:hypothetical protein